MEKKILDGFGEFSIYDKLKHIQIHLIEIQRLIESIEEEESPDGDAAYFIHRFIHLHKLRRLEARINQFLKYPLKEAKPGRPIQYPDGNSEKSRFKSYRAQGLSIREIARSEKVSPDTVFRKLKRYHLD
jgi:hypothetical protein